MKYYVAYGSNSPQEMVGRCPTSTYVGTALLRDWELVFSDFATILPKIGSILKVHLYRIEEDDERRLDYYEGYPRLYGKNIVDVEFQGKVVKALVYWMDKPFTLDFNLPHRSYIERVVAGYDYARIPRSQVIDAVISTVKKYLKESDSDDE